MDRHPATLNAARLFVMWPHRMAALWRAPRAHLQAPSDGFWSELDGLAESFIEQVGHLLRGAPISPWTRCQGVLRLSPSRRAGFLQREFDSLHWVVKEALGALKAPPSAHRRVEMAFFEAHESAACLLRSLFETPAPRPKVPFGGVVVEVFCRAPDTFEPADLSAHRPTNAPFPHPP